MAVEAPSSQGSAVKARSFLGWAFIISLLVHAVILPLVSPAPQAKKEKVERVSVSRKIKVVVPTPPPPTPTPPPPTPPPKQTPPPVKQTNPPPQPKLKVNPPKTTSKSNSASSEKQYVAPLHGSEEGAPKGTADSAPPAPVATGVPATPAPTPVPTATPTLKPTCANPNADANATNPVTPDYPDIAKQQGIEGTTQVAVSLDANGGVLSATVHKSSNNSSLDNAAISAAKASKYSPEIVNCVKTAGTYIFRADFTGQ